MNKHVLIIYTGGTIGMERSSQGYIPCKAFDERLQRQLAVLASDLPTYHLTTFEKLIDSANLCLSDWIRIADVLAAHWDRFDGFVVLHGTDTMAYTASALSFMLARLDKPVILTGAQIPLSEARSDAMDNVVKSLLFAANPTVSEVCIFFHNKLFRGNRCLKLKSNALDAFCSPNFPVLADVHIDINLYEERLLQPDKPDFTLRQFSPDAVVMMQVYPGIHEGIIDALTKSGNVKVLILQSYGTGNAPSMDQALIQRLAKANDEGIVIVNLSQCLIGGVYQECYATGETLSRIGVVSGKDLTREATFAKSHYLISKQLNPEQIRQQLTVPICGECG